MDHGELASVLANSSLDLPLLIVLVIFSNGNMSKASAFDTLDIRLTSCSQLRAKVSRDGPLFVKVQCFQANYQRRYGTNRADAEQAPGGPSLCFARTEPITLILSDRVDTTTDQLSACRGGKSVEGSSLSQQGQGR